MASNSKFSVTAETSGERLDKFLSMLPDIGSRSKAAALVDSGLVTVNGKAAKASYPVCAGDVIAYEIPTIEDVGIVPYDLKLDVIFEDKDVLVVNKPSGLVVHPAAGHGQDTLVNALVAHTKDLSMGFGEKRPGIVHRLDKETSGLIVVAKNDHAHEKLVEQFQAREIHRVYQAVTIGFLVPQTGVIQSYLARHPFDRKKYASVPGVEKKIQRTEEPPPPVGKWAVTTYKTLAVKHGLAFTELRLKTGRTHQIRVHVSEMSHPLVGDTLYGSNQSVKKLESPALRRQITGLTRFFLHARELGFVHPATGKEMKFEQNWPAEDLALIRGWGFQP